MSLISKGDPWLAASFVKTFEAWDTKDWTVFEWGSGGSTVWLARRCGRVISVEHDESWAHKVRFALNLDNLTNAKVIHTGQWDDYMRTILNGAALHNGGGFDCILVDGRGRSVCATNAIPYVRRVLIWDNASRGRYEPGRNAVDAMGWVKHVAKYDPDREKVTQADTWYWTTPEFAS